MTTTAIWLKNQFCAHNTFWLDSSAIPIDLQLPRLINAEHQALFVKQFLEEQPNILYNRSLLDGLAKTLNKVQSYINVVSFL